MAQYARRFEAMNAGAARVKVRPKMQTPQSIEVVKPEQSELVKRRFETIKLKGLAPDDWVKWVLEPNEVYAIIRFTDKGSVVVKRVIPHALGNRMSYNRVIMPSKLNKIVKQKE